MWVCERVGTAFASGGKHNLYGQHTYFWEVRFSAAVVTEASDQDVIQTRAASRISRSASRSCASSSSIRSRFSSRHFLQGHSQGEKHHHG